MRDELEPLLILKTCRKKQLSRCRCACTAAALLREARPSAAAVQAAVLFEMRSVRLRRYPPTPACPLARK
eukprot:scaffold1746_cov264-Pinguiococcus_pyrenoidosus.AAC.2